MHVALVTRSDLPDWEVDDRPLHRAFEERGVRLSHPIWDDPAVDWSAFDAVLVRTTWDYCDDRAAFVAWAERVEEQSLLMNSAAVIRWNTDKTYLRMLAERGIPTLDTLWLAQGAAPDLSEECRRRGWTRGFIKPVVGSTARETLRFDVSEEGLAAAQEHVARLLPDEGLMVQPYIESVETQGEVSAIFIDGRFTHGVRKVPVAGDYRVQDDFGASDEPHEFTPEELEQLAGFLGRLEDDLVYARFDMLRHPDGGLRLIELELVEPSLFFRHGAHAAGQLADAVLRRAPR